MNATTRALLRSLIFAVVLAGISLIAQDASTQDTNSQDKPIATFSSSVKVVNLFATVRDKKGNIVKNLNKEDFKLVQDGQPLLEHAGPPPGRGPSDGRVVGLRCRSRCRAQRRGALRTSP